MSLLKSLKTRLRRSEVVPEADVTTSASGPLTAEEARQLINRLTTREGELVSLVAGLESQIAKRDLHIAELERQLSFFKKKK
jgi:hypothetical protein